MAFLYFPVKFLFHFDWCSTDVQYYSKFQSKRTAASSWRRQFGTTPWSAAASAWTGSSSRCPCCWWRCSGKDSESFRSSTSPSILGRIALSAGKFLSVLQNILRHEVQLVFFKHLLWLSCPHYFKKSTILKRILALFYNTVHFST